MLNKYVLIETFVCNFDLPKNVIYAGALGVMWFN